MFETAGSLAPVQPVLTLVGFLVLPLLWTVVAGLAGVGKKPAPASENGHSVGESSVLAVVVALTAAVTTLGLAGVLAARLAVSPKGTVLFQHLSNLGRLGQLDLAFDLALDTRGATFAIVVAVVASGSVLHTTWSSRGDRDGVLAWTGMMTAGAMLFVAGDGFAPVLAGLGLLSCGAWGLSRFESARPYAVAAAGNVAVLTGLVFLFWSLGGVFGPEGYDADGAPRFILVATGPVHPEEPRATLAMTSHAGAYVSSDDADLPGEPIRAPFSIYVDPGVYSLRVQGGVASADVVVPRVALTAGRTHVLTPYGPTASLHVLDDQIAVPRLAASGGAASVRAVLVARSIIGFRSSAIVLILVLGGALAHAYALAGRRGPTAIATVLEALVAPWLALRLAPLVDPTGLDGALVVAIGAVSALALAARAACVADGHMALRGVVAAAAAIAVVACGFGEGSGALVIASSALVAGASTLAALDARRDVRWLGVACAAAVGVLPGAGASAGYIMTLAAALGSATTGSFQWAAFTAVIAAILVLAVAVAALAAFRVYDAVIHVFSVDPGRSRGQEAVVIVLAVVSLVGGTALGAGTTILGGTVAPLARDLSGPAAPAVARPLAVTAILLCVFAAGSGVVLARRVGTAAAPPGWLLALGQPYAMVASTGTLLGVTVTFLERSVHAMDRDVVEDIPAAIRDVLVRLGRVFSRADKRKDDAPLDGGADAIARLEVDDPRTNDRVRTLALLAMMALLGLVVLSSFLLR